MDQAEAARDQVICSGNREELQKTRVEKNLDDHLLKYKGAIGVDVAHKEVKGQKTEKLGITVYVSKKLPKEELSDEEAIPAEIEGIVTDVIECPNVWPSPVASPQLGLEAEADSKGQTQTPVLVGGLSISNMYSQGYGTLGFVISSNGKPTVVSCAHVVRAVGTSVIEPGQPQGGTLRDSIGIVSLSHYGDNVDIGLVPVEGRSSEIGAIMYAGKIVSNGSAAVGNSVRKTGATTGFKQGKVTSTTLSWVTNDRGLGKNILSNQVQVSNTGGIDFALPGDSGSAVINYNQLWVGMIVGGSKGQFTVCNPSSDLVKYIPPPIRYS